MKILLLHNRYNQRGGEDSVFEAEAKLLAQAGHVVRCLIFTNDGFLHSWRKLLSGILSVFNPASYLRTLRELKAFRPDVLHIHNLFSTATPAVIWAARHYRVPIVMTLHNFRLLCPSATLLHEGQIYEKSLRAFFPWDAVHRRVYRGSFSQTLAMAMVTTIHRLLGTWRLVSRFIVLSEFSQRKFLESRLGILPERYVVKPNFVSDRDWSLQKGGEFLFVGRLSSEKGILVLLEAFRDRNSQRLAIVGDGPLRQDVESAVAACSNIRYLGARNNKEVLKLMKEAHALILPSICYETFGMVAIEAFSVGTPVIASRLGSMAEIIEDGVNGLHFEVGNHLSLRAALDRLANAPDFHVRLCQGARDTWKAKYTPEVNLEHLMAIYLKVVNMPHRHNLLVGDS